MTSPIRLPPYLYGPLAGAGAIYHDGSRERTLLTFAPHSLLAFRKGHAPALVKDRYEEYSSTAYRK
jgi:hypothetical protein